MSYRWTITVIPRGQVAAAGVAPAPRAHEARMLPGTPRRDGGDGDPRQAAGRIRTVRKNRFPARLLGGCQVQFWRQRRIQVEEERGPRLPYRILARHVWRRSRGPVEGSVGFTSGMT